MTMRLTIGRSATAALLALSLGACVEVGDLEDTSQREAAIAVPPGRAPP